MKHQVEDDVANQADSDKVQTIAHIACEQSTFAEHGLCELDAFVESQQFATTDACWDICYNVSHNEK